MIVNGVVASFKSTTDISKSQNPHPTPTYTPLHIFEIKPFTFTPTFQKVAENTNSYLYTIAYNTHDHKLSILTLQLGYTSSSWSLAKAYKPQKPPPHPSLFHFFTFLGTSIKHPLPHKYHRNRAFGSYFLSSFLKPLAPPPPLTKYSITF